MSKDLCLNGGTAVKDKNKNDGTKNNVLPATMSRTRVASERRRLEEELNSLMLSIQQNETRFMKVNQENEDCLGNMKDILKKKDDTMEERKRVDRQLHTLNDEITTKRETLVRLQGNLQYKNQEKINEAIRRLEYQLAANNYRVSEEIKIVQEIDRLKRSKKGLCQYLASKDELDEMKHKMLAMRNNRDLLCRHVTVFRTNEEEIKRNLRENRSVTESLRKEIDDLHSKKRKTIAELKQVSQSLLHLKELSLPPKRTPSFKRKEENAATRSETTRISPQEGVRQIPRKCRGYCDPYAEHLLLCNTLFTYLQRLARTSTPTTTPVAEKQSPIGSCVAMKEIIEGDTIMVLHRREEQTEFFATKKSSKKGKKKRGNMNKTLSHGPEVFVQFDKLGLKPPSTVAEVATSLDALVGKKESIERHRIEVLQQKQSPSEERPTKHVSETPKIENESNDRDPSTPVLESVSDSLLEGIVTNAVEAKHEDDIERPPSLVKFSVVDHQISSLDVEKCLPLTNGFTVPNIIVNLVTENDEEEEDDVVTQMKMTNGIVDIALINVTPPQTPPSKSVAFSLITSKDFNVVKINGGNEVVGTDNDQLHIELAL